MVSIANPGAASGPPAWFNGQHLQLWFGDVVSESDARQLHTRAPNTVDIRNSLEFFRQAWRTEGSKVLVHCDYGASRSPGLAYVFVADQLGPGAEAEAFNTILEIRPEAVPNGLVVKLADAFLARNGTLNQPLKDLFRKINSEFGM
jgi:predicted protein tyrosine phosphatase